ncbi:MAG: alanine dehydrogenase [Acidimicrobiia bacterium]|nr:alanine dehydrogenase [Acidimicrobiia bacterium]MCY4457940.1 alanine dehydrogenase [Acidimicrobiaceae bacterium]
MLIGVPTEIKVAERRVGLTPTSVRELTLRGHAVIVQSGAGIGIGANDQDYATARAKIVADAESVFAEAEMIVKVKEPQAVERAMLHSGQLLFTYLHLAPDSAQTQELLASGATCIAYETVTDNKGGLPLLTPMSQVAGRMSIQAGARCLEAVQGGSGRLLGGVPGVAAARTLVLGGGVVGENAIEMAIGMGAQVTVLDRNLEVLNRLARRFGNSLVTMYSTGASLEEEVLAADLVVGAVLVKGATAPKLVGRELVKRMKPGSVLVDVAIDQGGCFATSRPTTHTDPTYVVDDVVHYCVANMPGAVPQTSTYALNNATLPFTLALADKGVERALLDDEHLLNGLNIHRGLLTQQEVAEAQGLRYVNPLTALAPATLAAAQ